MSLLSGKPARQYLAGLVCTMAGAWMTDAMDSLLPLALGGAVLVVATFPLVRTIRTYHANK